MNHLNAILTSPDVALNFISSLALIFSSLLVSIMAHVTGLFFLITIPILVFYHSYKKSKGQPIDNKLIIATLSCGLSSILFHKVVPFFFNSILLALEKSAEPLISQNHSVIESLTKIFESHPSWAFMNWIPLILALFMASIILLKYREHNQAPESFKAQVLSPTLTLVQQALIKALSAVSLPFVFFMIGTMFFTMRVLWK